MTTAGNDTASTRADEFVARVYQQVISAQAAQYAAAWKAGAGLDRFRAWLQDHAAPGPAPDADQAVAQLYSLHYGALVRLAAMLVRDTATAEDVVQDAFAAMVEGWHRLGDPDKALAYLRQAVVNRSRSVLRHRTAAAIEQSDPQPAHPDDSDDPESGHDQP